MEIRELDINANQCNKISKENFNRIINTALDILEERILRSAELGKYRLVFWCETEYSEYSVINVLKLSFLTDEQQTDILKTLEKELNRKGFTVNKKNDNERLWIDICWDIPLNPFK